jgi:hypothetical protein
LNVPAQHLLCEAAPARLVGCRSPVVERNLILLDVSLNGMVRPRSCPPVANLARGSKDNEHAMSQNLNSAVAVIGIDIGKKRTCGAREIAEDR